MSRLRVIATGHRGCEVGPKPPRENQGSTHGRQEITPFEEELLDRRSWPWIR
jgi:hypothetical protein